MVAQRRFGPLIGVVGVGLVVLCVRLFQVQIVEHEVWAQQAVGLVRSSRVLPSHRGSILDRNGNLLVRDEDAYRLDFRYREFRREHPLGVLAHAFASLEMRAVSIAEAHAQRVAWTDTLLGLSPADLDRFERGEELRTPVVLVPRSTTPGTDLRARRAADVRYYIGQLLSSTRTDPGFLRRLEGPARETTYLDAIAERRKLDPSILRARVLAQVERATSELASLAPQLPAVDPSTRGADPLERVLAFLDETRAVIEDETADELFRTAAGFEPGSISSGTLATAFDLDWIGRLMRWDGQRLARWAAGREEAHRAWIDDVLVPRVLVHVELESAPRRAERLLDEIAFLFVPEDARERDEEGRPPSWRDLDELAVLDEVPSLFTDATLPSGSVVPEVVIPLQDSDLRGVVPDSNDPWKIVGLLSDVAGKDDSGEDEPLREPIASETWTEWGRNRAGLEGSEARRELTRLVRALDRRVRAATDRLFSSLQSSVAQGDGPIPRLAFTESRRKRAETRDRFVQVDRGNRPVRLALEPDYALVERVARYPELFRGFEVRETTRRVPVARGIDGEVCAGLLLGSVGKPPLRELLKQRGEEARLAELRFQVLRSDAEERELRELAGRVQRADEWSGASGLEDYLDPELRGRPGWLQTEGLEERARNEAGMLVEAPRDGQDVRLTLDVDLQNAAQHVISHPRLPSEHTDVTFFENPVGAIALITTDGDVLAAASAPNESGHAPIPGRDLERSVRRERTLQRPTFNPPGSVFKPFVAAYALEKLGFDPNRTFECRTLNDGRGGFETMHCTGIHGTCDLKRALTVSCNSYFARLGLEYGVDDVLALADVFGFTSGTGIKNLGTKGRSGLREDVWSEAELANEFGSRASHLQFGNGLKVIQLVPMQVARAMAGLVTGTLPDVRIVESIGGQPTPHPARKLPIGEDKLEFVRSAMQGVVRSSDGSANGKGLDEGTLGFSFACKTGSADYAAFHGERDLSDGDRRAHEAGKMRKHTWIAGFFPVEEPKAILVVYLHDVSETSSHTAVYVAAQFLQTEAVRRFATAGGRKAAK